MAILWSSLTQGSVWSVLVLGVYITFRLLDIADLSAEGVFPLGGLLSATLISYGVHPISATLCAFLAGALIGLLAGMIHTRLGIPSLLTGILILTGLYSVNLHVTGGKSNIALLGSETIYTLFQVPFFTARNGSIFVITLMILGSLIAGLSYFFDTEIGLAFRATGDNERMSQANGIPVNAMKVLGYMIGHSLIALAGALVAQKDGFADIGMGIGTVVIGLASIMIVEVLLPNKSLLIRLLTLVLGSVLYRLLIDLILNQPWITIQATDLRLFSAVLLGGILYLPNMKHLLKRGKR